MSDTGSVHDRILIALHHSGWNELLLFIANSEDEKGFAFHILEIISLMFREQIAGAGVNMKRIELCCSSSILGMLTNDQLCIYSFNRFGGTYELTNTKSISERPLIYHHDVTKNLMSKVASPGSDISSYNATDIVDLNINKRQFRRPRNRKPLIDTEVYHNSLVTVQLFLQQFCWRFLQHCYNPLMHSVHSVLVRQAAQTNDETYFLWAMRFFMAFCRLFRFNPEYIR
ncbi:unnamed protein product [Protopolystoma xenopodis]|uniref:Timeless N-terminal domain-containing protein n=1 Tax=Protopolystoma xenopodis TaxID=117903 RepID=A0A3S5CN97_9PLAT|nr:unnamed protein product [Protopolystoma xenopodis]